MRDLVRLLLANRESAPPDPVIVARRGLVRLRGRAWEDDDGLFLPLGVSFFWAPWGWKFDRERTERNLAFLKGQVDYIRIFCEVGSSSWADRPINPTWPDYETVMADLIDAAYDRYGLRTQLTVFADGGFFEPQAITRDRVLRISAGREQKCFIIEWANEDNYGDAAGFERLVKASVPLTSILSGVHSPDDGQVAEAQRLLAATGAQVAVCHRERTVGDVTPDGRDWRQVRQSRDWADLKVAGTDNEPPGPKSSGAEQRDPLVLAITRATGAVHGLGAYVFHPGSGIRGGGAADVALGRAANFYDEPGISGMLVALKAVTAILPPDLPGWMFTNGHWADFPLPADRIWTDFGDGHGCVRNYGGLSPDGRFVVIPHGIREFCVFTARRACSACVYNPLSGALIQIHQLAAGESFTIRIEPVGTVNAFVILGAFK